MATIKGFALSGAEVKKLKDKQFVITEEPSYEILPDLDDASKTREKLVLMVRTEAGESEYYPNKTSQRTIMNLAGRDLAKWKGFKGKFTTRAMLIGKGEKDVIFVIDPRL